MALRRAVWGCLHHVSPTLPAFARPRRASVRSYGARSCLSLFPVPPPSFFPPLPVGPWTPPFIDTRRCPALQWGCSLELTWLVGKCPEPCTDNNVVVGGAP
jgi:hypothetical protein